MGKERRLQKLEQGKLVADLEITEESVDFKGEEVTGSPTAGKAGRFWVRIEGDRRQCLCGEPQGWNSRGTAGKDYETATEPLNLLHWLRASLSV